MKKYFILLLGISCAISAMVFDAGSSGAGAGANEATDVVVNEEFVRLLIKDDFSTFIDTKKEQRGTLATAIKLPFASTILSALGIVNDPDHAFTFLTRMFADDDTEQAFRKTAQTLDETPENIQYLQALFKNVDPTKATVDNMKTAMREIKHPLVPSPSQMGEQNSDGTYILPNEKFHPWAACNLLAFHFVEWRDKRNRKPRGLKKGGSGLFKN